MLIKYDFVYLLSMFIGVCADVVCELICVCEDVCGLGDLMAVCGVCDFLRVCGVISYVVFVCVWGVCWGVCVVSVHVSMCV